MSENEKKEQVNTEQVNTEITQENGTQTASAAVDTQQNDKKDEKKKKSVKREIWEWVYTLAIAIAIALLVKGFVFDVVKVDGKSMEPTLMDNDRLIVTKLGYKPHQGDIIILDSTYRDREEYYDKLAEEQNKEHLNFIDKIVADFNLPGNLKTKYYVKRVIALPGQTVDIEGGRVYVDGEILDEPYYSGTTTSTDVSVEYPITIDDNCVFVMGDNRNHSKDSRSSDLGQVPYKAILGKAQLRVWPLNQIGLTR